MKILIIRTDFTTPFRLKYDLYGGVGYYRIIKPAQYLKKLGHEITVMGRPPEQERNRPSFWRELAEQHDVIFAKHIDNKAVIDELLKSKKPIIMDFDDNLFAVDELSPHKFAYPEGSEKKETVVNFIKQAKAITVATEPLVNVYKQWNDNVYVLPNYCDIDDWNYEPKKNPDGRITIGWIGSASHIPDHEMMIPVFQKLIKIFGNKIIFSFMGHLTYDISNALPRVNFCGSSGVDGWEGHPEQPISFPALLAEQEYDIGIAPLKDSEFNRSRSASKWYEYSMLKIPTVASDLEPYRTIKHGVDGLLAKTQDEWIENLSKLINNETLRQQYGNAAYKRITGDYQYADHGYLWDKVCRKAVNSD